MMKVLWLGNIVLPSIAIKEDLPTVYVGGWMVSLSKQIAGMNDIELMYVFDSPCRMSGEVDGYQYRGIPCNTNSSRKLGRNYILELEDVLKAYAPDLIHIWGTENQHSLAMVEAASAAGLQNRVVISIQGLVSVYSKHYGAYLPEYVQHGKTLKDFIKGNIIKRKKVFKEKGILEREALRKVYHVIGRTDWDKACSLEINPNICYHFNNETLREEFYTDNWEYEKCEKHSLFCSQAHYPIKGLHLILDALKMVKKTFPDVKLYVAGKDYFAIPYYKRDSYEKYILKLIRINNLQDNICFVGRLNAEQMKKQYLRSNIFISSSSIENSPNSVGEAMLLGVPIISSMVGGVHNLMNNGSEGILYPADEPYMLAYFICDLFNNPNKAIELGHNAKKRALVTHDPNKNTSALIDIYKNIISKDFK